MFKNPITEETFDDREKYVESLIKVFVKYKTKAYEHDQCLNTLVEAFNTVAEALEPGLKKGTIVVPGQSKTVKVTRKTNVTYSRSRGEQHPLRRLMEHFDELGALVKVDYKESGSALQALMDRHVAGEYRLDDDVELAMELAKVRIEKPAKPAIAIEDRIDVPDSQGKSSDTF
jgi:hypothetical protein